ncbi:MAG: alkaline phosphatase family protein, partial [Porticoccus sp.]
FRFYFSLLALLLASLTITANASTKLVVQITADGLRGDLLGRYQDGFGKNGFNYFAHNGVVYKNAHYAHANTETIVGHATLATGASPSVHGMIGNAWFDEATGSVVYNVEDSNYPLLNQQKDSSSGLEDFDPSQKTIKSNGRSPNNLLVSTFSDGLQAFYTGNSKVYAVSGKDRGAIPLAGHTGKAFWYDAKSGEFVTSSYYYQEQPRWLLDWNSAGKANDYAGTKWELSGDPKSYVLLDNDDRSFEVDLKGYGKVFPHNFGPKEHPLFYTRLLVSPAGDRLASDLAKTILQEERLGDDDVPDFLSVSFSGVDAVNHFFGPSSLENEAVIKELDKTLEDLIDFIDDHVGLENVLLVLSADHGMADMPEEITSQGYQVGRVDHDSILLEANAFAKKEFGIEKAFKTFFRPYLYLDKLSVSQKNIDVKSLINQTSAYVSSLEGIYLATPSRNTVMKNANIVSNQIANNHNAERSGDIYVAQKPYWFLFEEKKVAGMHGSPWKYDTHVPVMFAGKGIKQKTVHRLIRPRDIAPTMSAYLGVGVPAAAQGDVLQEIVLE